MRIFFVGLYFILLQFFVSAQSKIDVLHYKFCIILNDKNDTIIGYAEIRVRFIQPASSIAIDLTSLNKQGKGMKVDNIVSEDNKTIGNFALENDKLNIPFSKTYAANDITEFTIFYHGIPDDGLIISKNKYGDRTFFADNWPNRAHHWIPCVDDPADKASFEFIVIAPSRYQVISNGALINNDDESPSAQMKVPGLTRTHWKEDVPLSTKVMVIGVAKFAVKEFADSPAGIPVSAWVYPQDSTKGFHNYSVAPGILKFLSAYIGPYPYNKLANVQSKTIFGGMENASAIFYDESSASSSRSVESLLAHEITHQWFGDMASEKSFAHLWLSEGFATYMTHIYIESKYGTDSMNHEMQTDRRQIIAFAKESSRPVVDSASALMDLLNANSYQKGSWVLHMLRRQLGDSIFHQIIRSYYDRYKGKNADTRDFEAVAEEVSGKNLDAFFYQWLYTPGLPQLHITWKYVEKEKIVSITVEQTQKAPAFVFPLELLFKPSVGNPFVKTINITKATETFSIPVVAGPVKIDPDPNISLLFEGITEESKN
ncbi:MAG: M1 family aminopeptidase [Chitinophagales bacterium]